MSFFHHNKKRNRRQPGQALPEYALILALVTLFCIAGLTAFGEDLSRILMEFAATIGGVQTTPQG